MTVPDHEQTERARDMLDSELASYDLNAVRVVADLLAQLAEREREIDQAVTILGTIRPLDVMEPDEDLSIGECAERWRYQIREMVAATHSDSEASE